MYIKRSLIALSLALVATTAQASPADREGAYVYGGVGKIHGHWKVPAANGAAGATQKQSGSQKGYVLGAGYRFGPYLAAETSFDTTIGNRRQAGSGVFTSRSFNVGGVGLIPVGEHVELFGKLAVGSRQQGILAPAGTDQKRVKQSTFAATPSLGANVYLTDALALRAEYTIPMSANKKVQQAAGVEKMRLNSWNVGMSYAF